MQCEPPDIHFYAEIRDFNLEFLRLLAAAGQAGQRPAFGLDAAVVGPIGRFNPAQLEAMAAMPCLLAGFATAGGRPASRVAEPRPDADPAWAEQARLFAAGLLSYIRQAARRDALRAALCVGPAAHLMRRDSRPGDLREDADRALRHLEARFRHSNRFWPDLVRAVRDGRPERLQLARLTAIQLATTEAGTLPPAAAARPVLAITR